MTTTNDEIRDAILRYLYDVHKAAKSPRTAAKGIRELQSAMKDTHGLKQQQVGGNLDYLIQRGWVREVVEERTFQTGRGTTQAAPSIKFKISDIGVDHIEGASLYRRADDVGRINITNIQGVTVVGDGNVVNTHSVELTRKLGELRALVLNEQTVSERARLDLVADIDTLQSQLQKPDPDHGIVETAWRGVERTATVAGLASAVASIAPLVAHFFS